MSSVYQTEPPTHGKVLVCTSHGDIDIELWPTQAPRAVRNFVQLCLEGYYDGLIFHRIIKGLFVQTGDPTGTGTGGDSIYGAPFPDEFHSRLRFSHRGIVAMANPNVSNANGSQWFITLDKCPWLDKKHTIFGKVTGNTIFNVLRLGEFEVDKDDRPLEPPFIKSVEVLVNPFEDIMPRSIKRAGGSAVAEAAAAKAKAEADAARRARLAAAPAKILSFGEDEEDGAGAQSIRQPVSRARGSTLSSNSAQAGASAKRGGMVSLHDVVPTASLPASGLDAGSGGPVCAQPELAAALRPRNVAPSVPSSSGATNAVDTAAGAVGMKRGRGESLAPENAESAAVADEMAALRRSLAFARHGVAASSESAPSSHMNDGVPARDAASRTVDSEADKTKSAGGGGASLLAAMRSKYKPRGASGASTASQGSAVGGDATAARARDEALMHKLAAFTSTLAAAKREVQDVATPAPQPDAPVYAGQVLTRDDTGAAAEDDKYWMVNKLKFKRHVDDRFRSAAGDDGLITIDPLRGDAYDLPSHDVSTAAAAPPARRPRMH